MSNTIKILMILTSHATLGDGGTPTGVWFEELTTPYYAFIDAGAEVKIASIKGGKIPIDPRSLEPAERSLPSVERFLNDPKAMDKMEHSEPVEKQEATHYDAVFLPGGHGTMWDLPRSQALATLLAKAWDGGKVIAAVCHGPAGLINVKVGPDSWLVSGRRISAFTNTEEKAVGLLDTVPFKLENRLRELGARYESGPDFKPHAVRDGNLVTGQNPASSQAVARLVLEAITDKNKTLGRETQP